MQVIVGTLFESIVYHIHVNQDNEVFFLIWDCENRMFDLVDAQMCKPLNVAPQNTRLVKKISRKEQLVRDIEIGKQELERLQRADERRVAQEAEVEAKKRKKE